MLPSTLALLYELRGMLHPQLDTVLDAAQGDRRVIDDLLEEAEHGKVISVSVHSLPKPADVPASP